MKTAGTVENLVIIGSGPAGHTAAIYAARAQLKPLMFEGFSAAGLAGGQLMTTTEVENFPGFPKGITGPELMDAMRAQSLRFDTRIRTEDVSSIDLKLRPFRVTVGDEEVRTRALILATGASARYLGLEGERRLLNRGVSACATCDGALPMFRNKVLAVVGGGDTAMEEALFLTRFASEVVLVHRRTAFRASKIMQERALAHPKVRAMTPFIVDAVEGDKAISHLVLRHTDSGARERLDVAGLFVAIGHTPNAALVKDQLDLDAAGYVRTAPHSSRTNIEGVFACGDVQDHAYRQAITAAGSGCQAAIDAERWLQAQV